MKTKSVDSLRQVSALLSAKGPAMPLRSRVGCTRSVKAPLKQLLKAAAYSAAAFR